VLVSLSAHLEWRYIDAYLHCRSWKLTAVNRVVLQMDRGCSGSRYSSTGPWVAYLLTYITRVFYMLLGRPDWLNRQRMCQTLATLSGPGLESQWMDARGR
jgi:hypothetical protein